VRPELCVGAIVVHGNSLLMIRRGTAPGIGLWSIPGGRVESGETMAEAVERETLEETGVVVRAGRLVGWVERFSPKGAPDAYHFAIFDFEAHVEHFDPPTPRSGDDAASAAWVPLRELGGYELVPGLLEFLMENGVLPLA
jgi:8-oxo-dGTP diphosphatase